MQRVNQPLEQVDPTLRADPSRLGSRLVAVATVGVMIAAVLWAH